MRQKEAERGSPAVEGEAGGVRNGQVHPGTGWRRARRRGMQAMATVRSWRSCAWERCEKDRKRKEELEEKERRKRSKGGLVLWVGRERRGLRWPARVGGEVLGEEPASALVRERTLHARAPIQAERGGRGGPHGCWMDGFVDLEVSASGWLAGDPEGNGEGDDGVGIWRRRCKCI